MSRKFVDTSTMLFPRSAWVHTEVGVTENTKGKTWIPACAGMTKMISRLETGVQRRDA